MKRMHLHISDLESIPGGSVAALFEQLEGTLLIGHTACGLSLQFRLGLTGEEACSHTEKRFRSEGVDFLLTLADQTHGYTLDTACGESRLDFAP